MKSHYAYFTDHSRLVSKPLNYFEHRVYNDLHFLFPPPSSTFAVINGYHPTVASSKLNIMPFHLAKIIGERNFLVSSLIRFARITNLDVDEGREKKKSSYSITSQLIAFAIFTGKDALSRE